ncbi:MAG: ribonuclease P protein component [Clostridiales bacterium]|jgi:ribonuclease P protein component|nr:ribonuclease P protein component [Clostridiales bacterium]
MKKTFSLKQNTNFRRAYYKGKRFSSPFIVLHVLNNKRCKMLDKNALGLTASTKIGKAVVRNRARRRMREAFAKYESSILPGHYIVLVARGDIVSADFSQLVRQLGGMLKKAGLFAD